MKIILKSFKFVIAYLFISGGTVVLLSIILQYVPFRDDVGIFLQHNSYTDLPLWKSAFYIHVFTAIFAVLAGFTQFSQYIINNHRFIHKVMGKLYAYNILLINVPAGFIIAIFASGGWQIRAAFIILDLLWCYCTYEGVKHIKDGDIAGHRRFMMRSYALTCSAITFRIWKYLLTTFTHLDPVVIHTIDAWMAFVPNLLFVEWVIWQKKQRSYSEV
ncbi:putative membrane protein [Chitinophaga skermanii]|uniref:Putative membrane protein n=1 Tax=Chitinophaga skermanii TaxID=331697 RepID=A0A327R1F4_9BACT|nr:DUF2306 domain-containing protein [Chitinophaga skermanii]RAJ10706.1 putative membrane protein [Chitinophaga skermanii]